MRLIIQYECSAAFQDVEGFVHLKVSVDRDARAYRDLLGSQSQITGAFDGVDLDEDVARIAEVNEMVAAIGTEHVSLWRRCLSGSLPGGNVWLMPRPAYAFDILTLDGEDLRPLPLSLRKTNLARLLARRPFSCSPGTGALRRDRAREHGGRAAAWSTIRADNPAPSPSGTTAMSTRLSLPA